MTGWRTWLTLLGILLAGLAARPVPASACTNPAGNEADQIYNKDFHTLQFCNGTVWVPFSGLLATGGGGGGCSNPAGNEADQIYNGGANHVWQFCNGTAWVPFAAFAVACTACNIFDSTVPGTPDGGPDSAVNLGMAFYSEVPGKITGIRFYKAATNTGTHIGDLWSSSGTKLAEVTFTGETASGWQTVSFSSPVSISAYTIYVASYLCPNGHYAFDANYFASAEKVTPPLHAAQNNGAPFNTYQGGYDYGPYSDYNGVYTYGSGTAFPSLSFNATNYYVDVVFSQ